MTNQYICVKSRSFSQTLQVFPPSVLQVIKGLNEEEKKMENLVRLRILLMNVFNFILFV